MSASCGVWVPAALLPDAVVPATFDEVFATLGRHPQLRLELWAAPHVGIALRRYLIRIEPLASLPVEQLLDRVFPGPQHHLPTASPDRELRPAG